MKRATSTRRTKKGATIQERKRKDGTIQRKRTNADGSIRNSRRNADGTLKSATRKTTTGGKVKSMRRDGELHTRNSERVAARNSPAGQAAKAKRMAERKRTRQAAAATRRSTRTARRR